MLAISLVILGAGEAAILEINLGLFSSGYGGAHVGTVAMIAAFFALAALCDAFVLLSVWALVVPALRGLGAHRMQTLFLAGVLGLAVPVSLDLARYIVEGVLGRIADLAVLRDLAGGSLVEMGAQALDQLPPLGWLALLAGVGSTAVLGIARLFGRWVADDALRFEPPRPRSLALGAAFCAVAASTALAADLPALEPIRFALHRKPSALLLVSAVNLVTDFDRDGPGLLSVPTDPDPFDASVHAYALDVPGNGRDENGLAGDHPLYFAPLSAVEHRPEVGGPHPPAVLLIFLETFRADLIGATFREREITPFMNRLARDGAQSRHAYAHSPMSAPSRLHLFQGTVTPSRSGATTLIDDFKELGFEIAYFSGQDDSFADSHRVLGLDRVDVFYDARSDPTRHTAGTSRGARQVSWKLLSQRVLEFLESRDRGRPLFLYVNLVDTHFPYYHDELDHVFEIQPLNRHEIRRSRLEQVWAAYVNAAANVDRGVASIVTAVREHVGDSAPALVITADHGEAFYEAGVLGHGQRLDALGTRVPLIVWGLGGEWPEPVGTSDIRGLLQRNLVRRSEDSLPRAHFTPEPARRLLLYMPRFDRPRLLALRTLDGLIHYSFFTRRLERFGPDDEPLPLSPESERESLETLIWNWEALRLRFAEELRSGGVS